MSTGPDEHDPKKQPDDPAHDEAEAEREAIARRLSEVLGGLGGLGEDEDPSPPPTEADAPAGDPTRGKLRLDRTGALADRPKLEPKHPYGHTGRERPARERRDDEVEQSGKGRTPRRATIPPPLTGLRPPAEEAKRDRPPDDEVPVPGGRFLYGENRDAREVPAYRIDRYPVTNAQFEMFVRDTGHRPPLYWPDGKLPDELREHPVVGVDYYDALAYARWIGKDLPHEDEWERAARHTDGRTYPWGNEPELGEANTARLGHKTTVPIGWFPMNVSPEGVRDLIGNVWEITHSPAPGGGVVVRGGSWYDFVLYAKGWFRFASRVDARNGTIGFRCVRREGERPDVAREVAGHAVEEAIQARHGPQAAPDLASFSAERRDLVPDYRRLRQLVADRLEEEDAAVAPGPMPVSGRKVPVKASMPPPLGRRPAPTPKPPPPEKPAPRKDEATRQPPKPKAPPPKPKDVVMPRGTPPSTPSEKPKAKAAEPGKPKAPAKAEHPKKPAPRPADPPKPPKSPKPPKAPEPAKAPMAPDRIGLEEATAAASKHAEVKEREERARSTEPTMPLLYWVFLGAGVLLVGILLTVLIAGLVGDDAPDATEVAQEGTGDGPDAQPAPPTTRPAQPTLPPAPADDPRRSDPPRILDGARADWAAALQEGVWFVVFLDANKPGSKASTLSARTASNLHSRMRDSNARVLFVFSRAAFVGEDGRLLPDQERLDLLRYFGAAGDVNVLLDAPLGPPLGGAARTRYRVKDPIYAVVLKEGRVEYRKSPFDGGFTVMDLEPLAVRATRLHTPAAAPDGE